MNWDDLRIALAVARCRTLTAAAQSLQVTHTTVSRRISGLETVLGVRVFDRKPEGLFVTAAGEEIIQAAERIEADLLRVQGNVLGYDTEPAGVLSVSTLDFIFVGCRDAFTSFAAAFPAIDLSISTQMTPVSLSRREADVALRLSDSPPEELLGRRVGHMTFGVFASSELVARVGAKAPLSDYPWIGMSEEVDSRAVESWMKQNAPNAAVGIRVDESSVLTRELVVAGLGAFFLPLWEGRKLGLKQVGDPGPTVEVAVWLLMHKSLRWNGRVRAFMEHMAQALPKQPALCNDWRAD